VVGFLPSIQPLLEMAPQPTLAHALQVEELVGACVLQVEEFTTALALQAGTAQPLLGMVHGTIHIHLTHLTGVGSSGGKLNILVQCALHMGGSSEG
jgi:hypothetical protein